jgi:sulfatase modifying factor 1
MKKPIPRPVLVGWLLLASLLPCSNEVPMLSATAIHATMRTEAPEEATACDAIRARIRQVTRLLRKAIANRNTSLVRRYRSQLRILKRRLAICQATPPAAFLEMVTVGNPGNAADTTTYGAVPYEFKIGKYEVTLAQYTAFLNAVAATDSYNLYDPALETNLNIAGISRSGTSGSFTYSVIGTGSRPVTFVTWFDAARFCNWLHNGRPTGAQDSTTTERGAYTLDGATSGIVTRNPGSKYWIPSEDEWYKAAYHQPADQGGDGDDYWLYPTGINSQPGNLIGPLPLANHANYLTGAGYSITQNALYSNQQNYLTEVGSYPGSATFYGTFDQGGNVYEWNDAVVGGTDRGLRGGSWDDDFGSRLSSTSRNAISSTWLNMIGFRVAGL